MEKIGIENIREAITIGIETGHVVAEAWEDGKINLFESLGILKKSLKLWKVAKNAKVIYAEFIDLDNEEKDVLTAYFVEKFDIPNDRIEHIIEQAFGLLIQMADLVKAIK